MKHLISITLSILTFIALLLGFLLSWYTALVVAVIVYIVTETVQRPRVIDKQSSIEGDNKAYLDDVFMIGMKRIRNIEHYGSKIDKLEVKSNIKLICQLGEQIFVEIEDKPDTIKLSRRFLNYYLESAEKVTMLYEKLSKSAYQSEETVETLKQVENTLGLIVKQFKKQIMKIQQADFLDLDVEIKVLERTLLSEGLHMDN
ncbi:MAG: 5-bromo-4-chloroindolyl phosphate hydrolysis family protein [Vallitaleaceae bacterium]|jgi:5-bromo-4-chloroindolyl phosphate hydrolysis protein|nr:5-bromo-4-chloroindolyl phosphate hydrolysis family protein [Vallitaleaceae bacterium]